MNYNETIKLNKSILDKIEKYIDEMSSRKEVSKFRQPTLVISKNFYEFLKKNYPNKFNF